MDPTQSALYPADPSSHGRVRERIPIDADAIMRATAENDEAKLQRSQPRDKMRFLSPSQLPPGLNVLKVLPPWTANPPHAGRFWRAVWVHYGLGPAGETKTALCTRRMNKLGMPKRKNEDPLGECPVCEALEAIWAIDYEARTPEQKKFLSDYKARHSYLFNVVWIKGGGKSHVEDGSYVFACSPTLGEPILTAFKFVLSMKPTEVPDNFDVQIKKMPAEGKVWGGKQVYDYQEIFPSIPSLELELDSPKYERFALDGIYKQKDAGTVEELFRQTPAGRQLLLGAPAAHGETAAGGSEDDIPFRHEPSAGATRSATRLAQAAG